MPLKINGSTSGSVTLAAPATGSDVTLTLPVTGFGKVLQVVQGTANGALSSTSATYADTGLSATITPSSTSSNILAIVSQQALAVGSGADTQEGLRLLRGSTTIFTSNEAVRSNQVGGGNTVLCYLDSPATTSATTYKMQFARTGGTGTVYVHTASSPSIMILVEVGP